MTELVKLYKNLRDFQLNNILYKTKEGLQKEAFDYLGHYLSGNDEYTCVFAIYDEDTDEYFVIKGGFYSNYSIGE